MVKEQHTPYAAFKPDQRNKRPIPRPDMMAEWTEDLTYALNSASSFETGR